MHLRHAELRIQADRAWLDALLAFAPDVSGLIICAAPFSANLRDSRENYAATAYRERHYATLIVNLLTAYENERDPDVRYDVALLDHRLKALLTWLDQQPGLSGLPLGLQATGTVAAAAVRLAAREPERISVLVSRAGRCDLAGAEPLRRLRTPLLLQVPGLSPELISPSTQAYAHLGGTRKWCEYALASANFSEPGVLEAVTRDACQWFAEHLPERPESEFPPEES